MSLSLGFLIRNGAEISVSSGNITDPHLLEGLSAELWSERNDITSNSVTVQWSDGNAPHPDINLYLVRQTDRWSRLQPYKKGGVQTLSNGTTTANWKELPKHDSYGTTYTYEARLEAVPTGYYATYDDANNIIKLTKLAEIDKTAVQNKLNLYRKTAIINEILRKNPGLSKRLYDPDGRGDGIVIDNLGNATLRFKDPMDALY